MKGANSRSRVESFSGAGGEHTHKRVLEYDADNPAVLVGADEGPHVVVERGRLAEQWRSERWDSLRRHHLCVDLTWRTEPLMASQPLDATAQPDHAGGMQTRLVLIAMTAASVSVRLAASSPDPTRVQDPAWALSPRSQAGAEDAVPAAVVERVGAAVAIQAGETCWQGFFVGPGLVVTTAALLGGRTVVQLLTANGRAGLGQVVAADADTRLAVLRVHGDLTPRVFVDIDKRLDRHGPSSAFLLRRRERNAPAAERVVLGPARDASGRPLVELSPGQGPEASGAACVDEEGRLLGVVVSVDVAPETAELALAGERVGALVAFARQAMRQAQQIVASRAPASGASRVGAASSTASRRGEDVESDTDRRRREGIDAFDRAAAKLGSQRAAVLRLQARYDAECVGTYVAMPIDRGVLWPYPAPFFLERRELPECRALQGQMDSSAEAMRRSLADAEEQARRAGVYPGTMRDVKRAHGLDAIR